MSDPANVSDSADLFFTKTPVQTPRTTQSVAHTPEELYTTRPVPSSPVVISDGAIWKHNIDVVRRWLSTKTVTRANLLGIFYVADVRRPGTTSIRYDFPLREDSVSARETMSLDDRPPLSDGIVDTIVASQTGSNQCHRHVHSSVR
jgi:hypothetical protein